MKRINPLYVLSLILLAILLKIGSDYFSLPEKPVCIDAKDQNSGNHRYLPYYVDCRK
jgi:hypothetical protein